jgi:hypothetical protein
MLRGAEMEMEEKMKVIGAYSSMEEMHRAGELGMQIMEKIYPWLLKVNGLSKERIVQMKANKYDNDAKIDEALWYLKLLREQGCVYQPEIRHALDFAIQFIREER